MIFVTLEEVLDLHDRSLREHGGLAGVREPGLVESALAAGQNVFLYRDGDAFDVAAAYAFHLAESQSFVDGNKRTAISTALYFLARNGIHHRPAPAEQDTLYEAMIALATHDLDKAGLAVLFRELFVAR